MSLQADCMHAPVYANLPHVSICMDVCVCSDVSLSLRLLIRIKLPGARAHNDVVVSGQICVCRAQREMQKHQGGWEGGWEEFLA
jgi:hypothetical protein